MLVVLDAHVANGLFGIHDENSLRFYSSGKRDDRNWTLNGNVGERGAPVHSVKKSLH